MKHIMVVDDEVNIREIVSAYLKKEGYLVRCASDGCQALKIFEQEPIDLIILDLMMPKVCGDEVCRQIRRKSNVPIIMLTAKVEDDDVIAGIKGGADDYVRKPFSVRELIVRVQALLRRTSGDEVMAEVYSFNDDRLVVDFTKMQLLKKGKEIILTPNEYKILKVLIANQGLVLSRNQIIEKTFGSQFDGFDRTIDTHIKNLRRKLEDNPKKPIYIKTIYSMGYKFGGDY